MTWFDRWNSEMTRRFATLLLALLSAPVAADNGEAIQDIGAIRAAAEQFIKAQPIDTGIRSEAQAGVLDPRLRLPHCDQDLQAFLPPGGRTVGNTTIGVRCTGGNTWSVYVPVRVSAFADVVTASRPVERGTTLSAADLRHERRDLGTLSYGYVLHTEQAAGKRVLRGLSEGTVLTPAILAAPQWVKRGERVTVLAQAGGMEVRMTGEAMMDGTEGAVVRVRNLNTARVIEGTVIAQGVIQVRL